MHTATSATWTDRLRTIHNHAVDRDDWDYADWLFTNFRSILTCCAVCEHAVADELLVNHVTAGLVCESCLTGHS